MVPAIETEPSPTLRAHRPEDFDRLRGHVGAYRKWSATSAANHSPREEVWSRVLRYAGHWQWMGFGFWALEEKSTGAFAGELGFAEFKRELEPSIQGIPEIGWVLAPHAHGKGYATEAVRAVVAWGDRIFDRTRTVCLIHPENLPSIRVAEKCGYKEFHRTTYKGQPTSSWNAS